MKKMVSGLGILIFLVSAVSAASAGSIDNKHNFSAEYVRTLNRNAATDSADAVVYNPAGTARMAEGLYLNLSGQYAVKDYSNTIAGVVYGSDPPDFVPSLFALYRKDEWGLFAAFTFPVGGGKVEYKKGSATSYRLGELYSTAFGPVTGHYMEGECYYYGFTFGGSYSLNDVISLSAGARYVDANIERGGHVSFAGGGLLGPGATTQYVAYEESGSGWAGIFGINLALSEDLNVGVRYETRTSLELTTRQKRDSLEAYAPPVGPGLVNDGSKRRRDVPALLGVGVSYRLTPKLRVEPTLTYYYNKRAKWDNVSLTPGDERRKSNGYDLGLAFEYQLSPGFKWSVGYLYTSTGIDHYDMNREAPELNAQTVGGGFAWKPAERWWLNVGLLRAFYKDETTDLDRGNPGINTPVKLEKEVWILSLGLQHRF